MLRRIFSSPVEVGIALEVESIAIVVAVVLSGANARRKGILDRLQRIGGEQKALADVVARDARDRVDVAAVARIQRVQRREIERQVIAPARASGSAAVLVCPR